MSYAYSEVNLIEQTEYSDSNKKNQNNPGIK